MLQQFKNINDLADYLGNLEERLKNLESENEKLQAIASPREIVNEETIERVVLDYLPDTNLIDPSFLKRAFAVWGHFFVANLIIGIVVGIAYACLMMVLFGTMFGNILQSSQ
jgi:hypothetical protein